MKYQSDEKYCEYRKTLIKEFIEEIKNLNKDSFMVKIKFIILNYIQKKKHGYIYQQ